MQVHNKGRIIIAMAAMAAAAPAMAGHDIIFAPRTDVAVSSQAHQGPYVAGSNIHVVNGAIIPGDTFFAPSGGAVAGGGSPGYSWATSSIDGGSGDLSFGNDAAASVDLASGTLRASTASYGSEFFGGPLGFASTRLEDTIFFTNSSGSAVTVSFTYAFDGAMANPYAASGANPGGSLSLRLTCFSPTCYNEVGDRIVFATGPTRTPNENWNYYWDTKGGCFGENIYCGQGAAPYFQWGLNEPAGSNIVDGWISTSLIIPTGQSSIGLHASLNLDCRAASSCDFGHTSTLRFDPLPAGLAFSSASGLLLTNIGGAVPEPASWALMILGFGLIGAAMRRPASAGRMRFA